MLCDGTFDNRPEFSWFRSVHLAHGLHNQEFVDLKHLFILLLTVCSLSSAQWESVPDIPGNRTVYSLMVVQDTLYVGTDSVVYVGANAGTSWSGGTSPVTSPNAVSCMFKNNNVLIVGTFKTGIFRSTNDGLSWQGFSNGLSGLGSLDISGILLRRDSLIAGTLGEGVFVTASDFTQPWSSWGDSITEYQGQNVFKMAIAGNTVLANAGANGYMFRYTDAQPWWNPIAINTPRRVGESVSGMASSGKVEVAGTTTGIYRSTDEGLSWERASATIPAQTFFVLLVNHGATFFAVTSGPILSSLLVSSDDAQTWQSLGAIPLLNILDVAVVGETMYLGRPGGLWKAPLSGLVTTIRRVITAPFAFGLGQNYPNPFNPSTRIPFSVGNSGFVSLKIYDMLGRELKTLVNENLQPGNYERTFDGTDLSAGVYVCRLRTDRFVESRKLLLLR